MKSSLFLQYDLTVRKMEYANEIGYLKHDFSLAVECFSRRVFFNELSWASYYNIVWAENSAVSFESISAKERTSVFLFASGTV